MIQISSLKKLLVFAVPLALISTGSQAGMSEKAFFEQRDAIVSKYSPDDGVFAALKAQVKEGDEQSAEYWRWRTDQYIYGQYPEYQPIYDAYTKGKTFNEIYAMPPENLGPFKPLPNELPKLPAGYFTENLMGNPHNGWHDIANNKIYIVYQGDLSDPYIASYDLESKKWDGPYKAGHSTLSKNGRKFDSHGRPILERDTKGHFHVIFGGHGGEREDGLNPHSIDTPHAGGRMLHVMSKKPNDISEFVEVNDITPFASYTASHRMADGDIYFFTRGGTHKSPWMLYKMEAGTQTFGEPTILTWPTPQKDDPIHVDTHYINPQKISDTEIAISYLWHTCNFLEYHDKTNYGRHNAYYMKLDTTDDTFYNAQNEKLTLPITIAVSHEKTLAYDSVKAKETSFGTRPLKLEDGTPALAYEARNPGYREWRMAAFKNGKWEHSLPLPGQVKTSLEDRSGNEIKNIVKLEAMGSGKAALKAAVVYRDKQGKTVFATANRKSEDTDHWRVDKEYLSLSKARILMQLVKNKDGAAEAVTLSVKKGAAQRLYLWHDGALRGNPAL